MPYARLSNKNQSMDDYEGGAGPYPQGPPMTDMTNIHSGNVMGGGPISHVGPLSGEDEREMVQLLFEMIVNEKDLELAKMKLAE